MDKIAKLPMQERQELIIATASKMKISEAIVEKDFWVCFCLDYLFHECKWKEAFAFKGGTSLSKAYGLIERFSEDIDLILDWRVLGYKKDEPWEERSNTKQLKFLEDSRTRLFDFLQYDFLPVFKADMEKKLGVPVDAFITEEDAGTVHWKYPNSFSDNAILNEIRLEIGAMAAWTPTQLVDISSYMAEKYPNVFEKGNTRILTTTAERTFWEKATILHQEAYRPDNSKIPDRYSRHYYDLYCMAGTEVLDKALAQAGLLGQVVEFKRKFYPRNWAKYELARMDSIKLMPAEHSIKRLEADYGVMRSMIYGDYPRFEDVLKRLEELENMIHIRSFCQRK